MTDFRYSESDWQAIKCAFAKIGQDADRIGRGGASLRDLIEIATRIYFERGNDQGLLSRRAAKRQASIGKLKALRYQATNLRDDIAAAGNDLLSGGRSPKMLSATETYINLLTSKIDLLENPISICEPVVPGSNAALVNRQYFWRGLIEIWLEFGGKEKGNSAVAFLYAATVPVVAAMPDGAKDKRMPKQEAIERWLERRPDKTRQ